MWSLSNLQRQRQRYSASSHENLRKPLKISRSVPRGRRSANRGRRSASHNRRSASLNRCTAYREQLSAASGRRLALRRRLSACVNRDWQLADDARSDAEGSLQSAVSVLRTSLGHRRSPLSAHSHYSFAATITPQATRAPALPVGWVFRSSTFSCTITLRPMIESSPVSLSSLSTRS